MDNVSDMIDSLGLRTEDAAKRTFTNAFKLQALNTGLIKTANLVNTAYLTELEYLKESVTLASGVANLSSSVLDFTVLKGGQGILDVKVNGTGGLFCTRIDLKDRKRLENTYLTGSIQNPIYWIFQNKIYVSPTTISSVDINFLRSPNPLLYLFNSDAADSGASATKFDGRSADSLSSTDDFYNGASIFSNDGSAYHVITDYVGADLEFTVTPSIATGTFATSTFYFLTHSFDELNLTGVEVDLNESLHEAIMAWAEGECWAMDKQLERRAASLSAFYEEIKVLNDRVENPEGIGTTGGK